MLIRVVMKVRREDGKTKRFPLVYVRMPGGEKTRNGKLVTPVWLSGNTPPGRVVKFRWRNEVIVVPYGARLRDGEVVKV